MRLDRLLLGRHPLWLVVAIVRIAIVLSSLQILNRGLKKSFASTFLKEISSISSQRVKLLDRLGQLVLSYLPERVALLPLGCATLWSSWCRLVYRVLNGSYRSIVVWKVNKDRVFLMLRVVSHITVIACTLWALFVVKLYERVGIHGIGLGGLEYGIGLTALLRSIVVKLLWFFAELFL